MLSQSILKELSGLGLENRGAEYKNSQDGTKYPDGSTLKNYYTHYLTWGNTEGRDGTPITDVYTVRFMKDEEVLSTQTVVYGHDASTSELKKVEVEDNYKRR